MRVPTTSTSRERQIHREGPGDGRRRWRTQAAKRRGEIPRQVENVVVAYLENHSWGRTIQRVLTGAPLPCLPPNDPVLVAKTGPGACFPDTPWARRRHVDHTRHDTTSVLALVERRFGLRPLPARGD